MKGVVTTTTPTTTATTTPREPRIFYFGVTALPNHDRALEAERVWGHTLTPGGMVWYSTGHDSRFPKLHVLVPPSGGVSYNDLNPRMLLIWKHMYERNPGYDWYVRTWDDNFIFKARVEEVAKEYDHTKKIEIGRTGFHGGREFMGGGGSSLASGVLVKEFVEKIDKCSNEATAIEDVLISWCRVDQCQATFIIDAAFNTFSPRPYGELNMYMSDLSCRRKYHFHLEDEPRLPATFHYVHKNAQAMIHKAWYETDCKDARNRTAEVAEFGGRGTDFGETVLV